MKTQRLFVTVFFAFFLASFNWIPDLPFNPAAAQPDYKPASFEGTLRVMTFNTLFNPTNNEKTLEVIEKAKADIIGLQEIGKAKLRYLARKLRYFYYQFPHTESNMSRFDTGILSKYPIAETLPNGVLIELPVGKTVAVFNVHLDPYPYEPYEIRDGHLTSAEEVERAAKENRLAQLEAVLQEMQPILAKGIPVFLTGDFNEPSHLDWTARAAAAYQNFGMQVDFPASTLLATHEFVDAYRSFFEDELQFPGDTWTTRKGADEVHDRIDYVYFKTSCAKNIKLQNVEVIGESLAQANIVVSDFPSDHRAVLATFDFPKNVATAKVVSHEQNSGMQESGKLHLDNY